MATFPVMYIIVFYCLIFFFIVTSLEDIPIKIKDDEVKQLVIVNNIIIKPPKNTKYCLENLCGENAEYFSGNQIRYCSCRCGFFGDPNIKCEFLQPSKTWRVELAISMPIPIPLINVSNEDLYSVLQNSIEKKNDAMAKGMTYIPSSLIIGDIMYCRSLLFSLITIPIIYSQ